MEISTVVFFYIMAAMVLGYVVLKEVKEPTYMMKKGKRLGPSYWGHYADDRGDLEQLNTIVPPPTDDDGGHAGNGSRIVGHK